MKSSDLTFGIEIECYVPQGVDLSATLRAAGVPVSSAMGSIHAVTSGWKVVHDGSLGNAPRGMIGREVVSPILKGEADLAIVARVAEAIEAAGGVVNQSCGFHVHVGAGNASVAQLKNASKLFLKYEAHLDSLCPMSRRNNRFAQSNLARAGGIETAFAALDRARTTAAVATVMNGGYASQHYTHHRYHKLNLQSLATHGTLEFRQQAGTVNGKKMTAWVALLLGLVACAFTLKSVRGTELPPFARLLKKVDRDTAEFLKQRRNALARGATLPA